MFTKGNSILKSLKPSMSCFAIGVFMFCVQTGLSNPAAAQTSPASAAGMHDEMTAAQLSAFYRNDFVKPVAGEPFSAVEERVTALRTADAKLENRSVTTTRISRDADGRLRIDRESVIYGNHDASSRTFGSYIADPLTHRLLILDPDAHTAVEVPWVAPADAYSKVKNSRPATDGTGDIQLRVEALGVSSMQGLTVDGSVRELTIPIRSAFYDRAVAVSIETWTSRELKIPVYSRSETKAGEISTTALKNIVRTAPDRQLFELPTDYSLSSPGSDTVFAMSR
jgi:hypothetical protein